MKTSFIGRAVSGLLSGQVPVPVIQQGRQILRRAARTRCAAIFAVLAACLSLGTAPVRAVPAPDANSVLILDDTVSGGASSIEAVEAAAAGYSVTVVDAATWGATTAAEFATVRSTAAAPRITHTSGRAVRAPRRSMKRPPA